MTLYYACLIATAAELPDAIAAAERWIAGGGFNPHRFTWECSFAGLGFYQLYVSCSEERAR